MDEEPPDAEGEGMISVAELAEIIDYDPQSGLLTWRERPEHHFAIRRLWLTWNTRYAGTPALNYLESTGYRAGNLNGRKAYAHRVALALTNGAWPDSVDHINGDKSDNRAENLRDVSHAENMRNAKRRVDNRSGVCGVFWNGRDHKWEARIKADGRVIRIGQYGSLEGAANARLQAEQAYGFHENHGRAA